MARVLVVDDDRHIRDVVRFALERAGHAVVEAADGREALRRIGGDSFDIAVLDIVMPEEDGLEVCRAIRRTSRLPILFLSSRDDEIDRVLGLELGADDYLTKPFSPREIVARIAAVLRRTRGPHEESPKEVLRHGALVMDVARHTCRASDRELTLTVVEFALLQALLGAPGRVLARNALVERAYGPGHYITDRTVDSHIRRLRKKLSEAGLDPIETVYGIGYRLREST